ncbi:MAG TPA: hypothetical protein VJ571_09150 [Candidatus Nitrosotalea sp.]|nr:hypothetical protein [Candidatus Nitrosotalea sp.]
MSKKMLVFAALFSIALSMTITQEASALTMGVGEHEGITSNWNPNKVCGNHVCQPGENTKWSSAVSASQRQGPGKATGAQFGFVVMHQIVVNYLAEPRDVNQYTWINSTMPMQTNMNSTGSMPSSMNSTGSMPAGNSTGSMPSSNSTNSMPTNTNSTG